MLGSSHCPDSSLSNTRIVIPVVSEKEIVGTAGLNNAQHPLDRNLRSVREFGIDVNLVNAVAQ
jgi:hypothetical protein